jgi:hypothetical protein
LPGFRDAESIDLPDGRGLVSVVIGDDRWAMAGLESLLECIHGIGALWAADMIAIYVTRSRCPFCGGNTFARTNTDRRDGRSWREVDKPRKGSRIVRTEMLHCTSGRTIQDDMNNTVVCNFKATVINGVPQGLVPSLKVIRKAQEVMRAAFTPIEEAQHRGIVVGTWLDGARSDAWTDATHDGTLAPRVVPKVCNPGFI